jgi:hypothetical protein
VLSTKGTHLVYTSPTIYIPGVFLTPSNISMKMEKVFEIGDLGIRKTQFAQVALNIRGETVGYVEQWAFDWEVLLSTILAIIASKTSLIHVPKGENKDIGGLSADLILSHSRRRCGNAVEQTYTIPCFCAIECIR